ncbi:hypothetical protein F4804DRAFT_304023 [Jackrogersella minutella]|nr:hypothetical protein F4804DRAFT_304023 [Jackrogersella minutella]
MPIKKSILDKDLYSVLGVASDASHDEIKKAYQKLALKHHPDKAGDTPESHEKFVGIQEAWDVLREAKSRSEYNRHRAKPGSQGQNGVSRSGQEPGPSAQPQPQAQPEPQAPVSPEVIAATIKDFHDSVDSMDEMIDPNGELAKVFCRGMPQSDMADWAWFKAMITTFQAQARLKVRRLEAEIPLNHESWDVQLREDLWAQVSKLPSDFVQATSVWCYLVLMRGYDRPRDMLDWTLEQLRDEFDRVSRWMDV